MPTSDHEAPEQRDEPSAEVQGVMHRNIQALLEVRRRMERDKKLEEVIADRVTGFTGSMTFVYLHVLDPALLKKDVRPEAVLEAIDRVEQSLDSRRAEDRKPR